MESLYDGESKPEAEKGAAIIGNEARIRLVTKAGMGNKASSSLAPCDDSGSTPNIGKGADPGNNSEPDLASCARTAISAYSLIGGQPIRISVARSNIIDAERPIF